MINRSWASMKDFLGKIFRPLRIDSLQLKEVLLKMRL